MFGPMYGWGWGMMHPFGLFLMLALLTLVIIGAILFARVVLDDRAAEAPDVALQELRRRYARGEIDDQEFETKRRELVTH